MSTISPERSVSEDAIYAKVAWRIIPLMFLCYIAAYLDRVNVGFAALQMNQDIGLSSAAFGLGGGLFYITYVLCEVPSNLAMEKVGARLWIARIMITWGIVAACMALVVGLMAGIVAIMASPVPRWPLAMTYSVPTPSMPSPSNGCARSAPACA